MTHTRFFQALCTVLVADTPVLLSVEGRSAVGLPHVVEGSEPDDIGGDSLLDGGDGGLLILDAGNGNTVGATLSGPAGLGDPGLLATADAGNTLHLLNKPLTRVLGSNAAVEEGVRVDSDVVRELAKSGVGNHGDESVDSDNATSVASGGEGRLGRSDTLANISNSELAAVDNLVTNGDGVESGPVAVSGLGQGLQVRGEGLIGIDVVDTCEDLQVVLLASAEDGGDLVAVNTVGADEGPLIAIALGEGLDGSEVAVDLILGLAATVIGVRRVDNTVSRGTLAAGRRGRGRGSSLGGRGLRAVRNTGRDRKDRGLSGGCGLGGGGLLGDGSLVDRGQSGRSLSDVDRRRRCLGLGVDRGGRSNSDGGGCGSLTLSGGGVRSAVLVNEDDNVGELSGNVGVVGLVDDLLTLLVELLVTTVVTRRLSSSKVDQRQSAEGSNTSSHHDE